MGLFRDYTSGVGMPRPKWQHQEAVFQMIGKSYHEMTQQGYGILPEPSITNDWNDIVPDLMIFNRNEQPLSVIEITTHKELRAIMRKCKELMIRFTDAEYFVYDYESIVLKVNYHKRLNETE